MSDSFVHLHVHSHYSLLDGAAKISELIGRAVEYKMPALALTDHGNLFGALEFYKLAKKSGIKPIIGYEAYVAPTNRFEKERVENRTNFHVTLLAKDITGYKNLIKLASEAYLTGFYYKPRIDKELFAQNCKGIIALSGCLSSEPCQYIVQKKPKKAEEAIGFYKDLLGEDFYIEIQDNGIEDQNIANEGLVKLSKSLGIPLVFTSDIHYLKKEDAQSHEVLLCLQSQTTINSPDRWRFGSNEFYFKSPEEMRKMALSFPSSADNTLVIADKVNIDIKLGEQHLPTFTPPDGKTNEGYLRELCHKGLEKRYGKIEGVVAERLENEFRVICKMGFVPYFLIVWDFINYAREHGIGVGPGRGSAAGSIVAYGLGITNIDPLRYELIFERFLNEGRNEMPDIDTDFETLRREEVIDYVKKKYGESNVCQIITFGTLAARASIRDVGRVLEVPLSKVDEVAKKVPALPKMTLEKALEEEPTFKECYEKDEDIHKLVDIALRLEGLAKHVGTHAAGVIISDRPLVEYCPLYKAPDDSIITQYSMDYVVDIGLLKMDFLGLNTLTLILKSLEIIKQSQGIELDIDKIPLDNTKTYSLLSRGETIGVFQLESDGMRELIKKLKPDRFEDIIALVAMYRPGPLQSGMVDTYVDCKHGVKSPVYDHPVLEKILKETYGIILYQEQAMQIAKDLSGFTLAEADKLRKAMGKKIQKLMDEYRDKFIKGAVQRNVSKDIAEKVFDLINYFSGYGFNKSHSAAYAMVTYQTAYLKANYPLEFMAALMTIETGDTDKIVRYIEECEGIGIKILPPDINKSESFFSVEGGNIRFGLSGIKGAGEKAIEAIIAARKEVGEFRSLYHICEEVDLRQVNKQVFEALIKAGALDSTGAFRRQMLEGVEEMTKRGHSIQKAKRSDQLTLFDYQEQGESKEEDPPLPNVEEFLQNELLEHEKETLGFYFSGHPLDEWKPLLRIFTTTTVSNLAEIEEGSVTLGGMITNIKNSTTKKGDPMFSITLEDVSGSCKIACYKPEYDTYSQLVQTEKTYIIKAKVSKRDKWINTVVEKIIPIEEAPQILTKQVLIKILSCDIDEEKISKLRQLFGSHRGNCPVLIEIYEGGYRIAVQVSERFYLKPSLDFAQKAQDIIGKDRVLFSG